MKTLARIAFGAVFAALTTIVSMSAADATCSLEIYANRAYSNGNVTYFYGATSSTSTFSYYAGTQNATLASAVFAATAQRNKVFVTGNIASCPTTGSLRYIGTITSVYISP